MRTPVDALLYRTARELLEQRGEARPGHARSRSRWRSSTSTARLTVADDGVGRPDARTSGGALGEGHIGLASHALRIEAAGGRLTSAPGEPRGTVATVELPVRRSEDTGVVPRIDPQADGIDGRAAAS